MQAAQDPTYPAMPWRLVPSGLAVCALHLVDLRSARERIPPELPILQVLPGRTLGGLFLAEYGPGSDLRYNELIVSGGVVRHGGRPAAWVTDLFVDSTDSVEGGRRLLGAPKHLATFSRAEGDVTVHRTAGPVCRVRYRRRLRLWRQRFRVRALHRDVRDPSGATAAWHGQELSGRWGLARVETEIPPGSPLRRLGLARPLPGLCGEHVDLLLGGAPFLPLRLLAVSPTPP